MGSIQDIGRAKITGDFTVHIPKLCKLNTVNVRRIETYVNSKLFVSDPEKGVYVEPLHEIWFGSLFNGSVARYNLTTKEYEYISIPDVTGKDG